MPTHPLREALVEGVTQLPKGLLQHLINLRSSEAGLRRQPLPGLVGGQVDDVVPVLGPLGHVGHEVGHEHHVGRVKGDSLGVVLGGGDVAVLQLLREGVQVVRALSRAAGDVKQDDPGAVGLCVDQCHVLHAPLQEHCAVVLDEVGGQPGLAQAADLVKQPHDLAVVRVLLQVLHDVPLPGARVKLLVCDLWLAQVNQALQAVVELDDGSRHLHGQVLHGGALGDELSGLAEVVALALAHQGVVAALPGAVDTGVLLSAVGLGLGM